MQSHGCGQERRKLLQQQGTLRESIISIPIQRVTKMIWLWSPLIFQDLVQRNWNLMSPMRVTMLLISINWMYWFQPIVVKRLVSFTQRQARF